MITSSILCYMYIRVTYCYYREWKYLTWCQFGRVHKTQITNIQYEGKHNYSQPPKLYINTSNIFLISQLQCTIQGDSIFNCIIIWNIYAAWAYYYLRVRVYRCKPYKIFIICMTIIWFFFIRFSNISLVIWERCRDGKL